MTKCFLIALAVMVFPKFTNAQTTAFERSHGKATATYSEIIDFYRQLDKKYSEVLLKEMGQTDAGLPLHLALLSADGRFDPNRWHVEKKLVILINNGIHPGEPDGIDASMMFARDLATGKLRLPANVVIAIIPVYNIGGCLNRNSTTRVNQNGPESYGFRGNSQNLDLNRDFIKCDSKEAQSFTRLFHWLDPDIFLDNHVSDGADYQHTMTLITTQYEKLGPVLGDWLRAAFEPSLYKGMSKKNWDLIPYVDFGATDFKNGMTMFFDPANYSSGYASLFNTVSFISETHMLKPFPERVRATYDLMQTLLEQGAEQASTLISKRKLAKQAVINQFFFLLGWKPDSSRFSEIRFSGYETDSVTSDATGLKRLHYDHGKPYTKSIKFYNYYASMDSVNKPKAYLIPSGWQEVITRLEWNGVKMAKLKRDSLLEAEVYRVEKWLSYTVPYEKHHKNYGAEFSISREKITARKGDFLVFMEQPANRYIAEVLEPGASNSFFAWNFFDAILQQKEGYSDYRWEPIAAEVLSKDSSLQHALAKKKTADPVFANDANAILNFIYKHSPYYEPGYLRYPILRIID